MPAKKPILIDNYDYAEFAKELNVQGKTVVTIYDVDSKVLSELYPGVVIQWDDEIQNANNSFYHGVDEHDNLIWNGEVYACFEDFVVIVLY